MTVITKESWTKPGGMDDRAEVHGSMDVSSKPVPCAGTQSKPRRSWPSMKKYHLSQVVGFCPLLILLISPNRLSAKDRGLVAPHVHTWFQIRDQV